MAVYNEWCFCPHCNYWVPAKFFIAEYDPVDKVLVQMCYNCARELGDTSLPSFPVKPFQYQSPKEN